MTRPQLKNFRRIVVKVGSSLLIDSDAGEVRAGFAEKEPQDSRQIRAFKDLPSAAAAFDAALAKIAA